MKRLRIRGYDVAYLSTDCQFGWFYRIIDLFNHRIRIQIYMRRMTFAQWMDRQDPDHAPHCEHGNDYGVQCGMCEAIAT